MLRVTKVTMSFRHYGNAVARSAGRSEMRCSQAASSFDHRGVGASEFLIAELAAVVYDPYPGPSVALDVCACPQFMPVEQKSVREPPETRGV